MKNQLRSKSPTVVKLFSIWRQWLSNQSFNCHNCHLHSICLSFSSFIFWDRGRGGGKTRNWTQVFLLFIMMYAKHFGCLKHYPKSFSSHPLQTFTHSIMNIITIATRTICYASNIVISCDCYHTWFLTKIIVALHQSDWMC